MRSADARGGTFVSLADVCFKVLVVLQEVQMKIKIIMQKHICRQHGYKFLKQEVFSMPSHYGDKV